MKIFDRSIMPDNHTFAFIRGLIAAGILWLFIYPSSPLSEYEISLHIYVEMFMNYLDFPLYDEGGEIIDSFAVVPVTLAYFLDVYIFFYLAFFAIQALALIKGVMGLGGSSSGSNPTGNIDRVLQYRDSVMGNMNNDEAANVLRETAWLDSAKYGPSSGSNTTRARNYTDSKLGNMSNDKALDWVRNRKK